MMIKSLIIDDEQLARDMLEAYAKRLNQLEIVAKCSSAQEAQDWLNKREIDLLFLDIHMPLLSGIDFVRQQDKPPLVVFTTAYADYALAGFELNAVDYLLKPIGFDRFQDAVQKVVHQIEIQQKALAYDEQRDFASQFILVKEGHNHRKISLEEIRYIEAMREYVIYHTSSGKVMELKAISHVEKSLPTSHFLRIHRSFIVAKASIKSRQGNKFFLWDGASLPLGKTYRTKVIKILF